MKKLDKYLTMLHEEFNARIAIADIEGDFNNDWTDCYEIKCQRKIENKYEKNFCKAQCYMSAANKAISRLNSIKGKCSAATNPNSCVSTLKTVVERFQKKMVNARSTQAKASAQMAKFKEA